MPYINRDQLSTQDLILEVESTLSAMEASLAAWKAATAESRREATVNAMLRRYPGAVYGKSQDYLTCDPISAAYAIIALPDGYAVHKTIQPAGVVGALVERVRI
jgi:hypothetical protein